MAQLGSNLGIYYTDVCTVGLAISSRATLATIQYPSDGNRSVEAQRLNFCDIFNTHT